jgi:hypothetical protein
MKIYVMKKFGKYDRDGLQVRMLLGANNTGSDNWQSAMGCKQNPATLSPRGDRFHQESAVAVRYNRFGGNLV